jgi:DNA-binding MarR family transcriptional regulator
MIEKKADPELERFVDRVTELMPRLWRGVIGRERNYVSRGLLSLPQIWILDHVAGCESCRMSDVARALKLPFSSVTGLMDRLVELKLIERLHDTEDRRAVLARVTAKGRQVLRSYFSEKRAITIHLFELVPPAERAAYLVVLEKVVQRISIDPGCAPETEPTRAL